MTLLDRFRAQPRQKHQDPAVRLSFVQELPMTERELLAELDPYHPSRSTLEVKTRRFLVAHGITDFVRELPLDWNGRTYRYDFAFERARVILEANGRRWHDDPADYEHDHEKRSVPARHGYRLLFATWTKVTTTPAELVAELRAAMATHREHR